MQPPRAPYRSTKVVIPVLLLVVMAATAQAPPSQPVRKDASTAPPMSPEARAQAQQILRGRTLVLHHGCGDCHGGYANPGASYFLAGMRDSTQIFQIGPFKTYPRNLTPDNATGLGRFSERQIFNAIRYGLRPGETPDVAITGMTPGQGNFPANPKYLAPPMPWPAFRHMTDQEIMDIAAYLKRGLKPVANRVPDSEGPPDFWAGEYSAAKYGPYPVAAFPGAAERAPQ
jgi:cytochrome c553